MTAAAFEKNKSLLVYLIIIVLPFLLFYWIIPFVSNLTIGNDYPLHSIHWQMELLFSIKTGSFPLYVPGFTYGHSSSAMTLGQVFHPISHIASMLPGYWDGKALQWNTFLRLLSLGVTHLALFLFLRKIRISMLFAFLLSCITVYNLRMLDLFRFGASLETYTGFLFLCTAIGWHFLKPSKLLGPLSIIGSTYWLTCSGHPSMMYYGILGAGLFLLVIPLFLSDMSDKNIKLKEILLFWSKSGFCIFLGVLLSSAYVLPYYFDFIQWNTSRVSQSYDFSLSFETFYGIVSNFFMPLLSEIHGAFGGSYLILIAVSLPVLSCFRIRIPLSIWIVWGVVLLVFLYILGARTPIHRLAWEYLPFASSVRGEGRISIVMPILLMLLLSWIFNLKSSSLRVRNLIAEVTPYMLLAFISLFLIVLYSILSAYLKPELSIFSPKYIHDIPLKIIMTVSLIGMTSLAILILYGGMPRARPVLGISLCVIILIHIGWTLRYGIYVEERSDKPSFDQMTLQKKETLNFPYHPGSGLFSSVIVNQLDHSSFIEPFLGRIFSQIIPVASQDEAYDRMVRYRLPHQIFVENYSPEKARSITDKALNMSNGSVDLIYSSFNRLQFRVISETPALFGLSYPYTGHWNARVNGNQVRVYRANGASHAVEIPAGESLIEFRYWSPAAFWGIVISCLMFVLIGLYVCCTSLQGALRVTSAVLLIMAGASSAALWNHSLYTGDNLGTQYTSTYTPPESRPNIAYGKKTLSFPLPTIWQQQSGFYLNHSSRIVDGNRTDGSGYKLLLEQTPAVTIDLYKTEIINSLVLYESGSDTAEINRVFELLTSPDLKQWEKMRAIPSISNFHRPIRIEFASPIATRYIQIRASGHGNINLDEVEIY